MKWASPGPALISRLGGHFPAGKCHRKEELWPLPRTQSPEGWGVGSLLGGSKDPRGMLIAASGSWTLGAPLQVPGAVPRLLQSHPLRDIRPPAPLPCQPRGPELRGPNWPYPAPPLHGGQFGVVCPGRGSKAKEEPPPSPALEAPAALSCLLWHLRQDELIVNSHNHTAAGPLNKLSLWQVPAQTWDPR